MPTVIVRMGEVPTIVEECADQVVPLCGATCCRHGLKYDCPGAAMVCLIQAVTAGVLGA